jgi:hypothetical protein
MHYAPGRSRKIVAIVFAYPLLSPPPSDHNNKILWVLRRYTARRTDLLISAQRMVGLRKLSRPVARVVRGGPGPSIINLPTAGCWRLTLRWSGKTDALDLQYKLNPRARSD